MKFTEGDIEINIPGAVGGGRFDGPKHGLSHCMKAVDFVMELADRYLFIELKESSTPSCYHTEPQPVQGEAPPRRA